MIEYDYSLQINELDEIKTFVPAFSKRIDNVCLISGPNSVGKSTLMNIIALGMYGITTDTVNKTLKSNIDSLINSNHKRLVFRVNITTPDESIRLHIIKSEYNGPIVVEESIDHADFKKLSESDFKSRYSLIYDIPEDPRTRIRSLSRIVKNDLLEYEYRIKDFFTQCAEIVKEVRKADSSLQIDRLSKRLKTNADKLKNLIDSYPNEKQKYEDLLKLLASKELLESDVNLNAAEKAYREAISKIPAKAVLEKSKINAYKRSYDSIAAIVIAQNESLGKIREDLSKISDPRCDSVIKNLGNINLDKVIDDKKLSSNLIKAIHGAISIAREYESTVSQEEQIKCEMFEKLIQLIRPYTRYNIDLPGYSSLETFIKELDSEYYKISQDNYKAKWANGVTKECRNFNMKIVSLESLLKNLKKPDGLIDEREEARREHTLGRYKAQLDQAESHYQAALSNAKKYGVNKNNLNSILDKYIRDYPEERSLDCISLKASISALGDSINKNISDQELLSQSIEHDSKELEKYKTMKDHPLKNKLTELEVLEKESQNLFFQINRMRGKQESIDAGQYGKFSPDDAYFINLWKYLGKTMGKISHRDEEFELESVNTIEDLMITTSGKEIHISDMGTGQTQVAYLRSLLKKNTDRIIIALFDEVSTMTRTTMQELFDEFKVLQERNKLLVGIMAQPNDDNKLVVESMGL